VNGEAPAQLKRTTGERQQEVLRLLESRPPGQRLDLCGYDLSGMDLRGQSFHDVIFGRRYGATPPADLRRTLFSTDKTTFEHCDFTEAELDRTDFRGATLVDCDFRYAVFNRTQLAEATVRRSDFYRAMFDKGTVMARSTLEQVSLDSASLDGMTAIDWETLDPDEGPLLAQEGAERDYREFLETTVRDRPTQDDVEQAVARRFRDAARVYRSLSGVFMTHGRYRDAGLAYARSRRLERRAERMEHRRRLVPSFQWVWLWFADLLCGFGESLGRVAAWLAVVAVMPGLVYWSAGGVEGAAGVLDHLLFSLSQLRATTPEGMSESNAVVEWIGVSQTLLGVALLGVFGFILANKIRNS
jgi:uncharacterized protein YjbI with pentapeptide repeats